ncbi:hypothetical protein NDN08_005464 [Rhodosorus marinus]|uniref:Cyclin N-terminal domain-containing protein n=1 Tax=Rhodosorus marinus TaxID=101924 RepID=A0AAV8V216_9RHOD|nr:hypothetical protein NDN08_005464 [Rhodosorus marinus]
MEAGGGRYSTRLRSAHQGTSENNEVLPGKRTLRQSQRGGGNVAKRALGDITNNAVINGGNGYPQEKKTTNAQRLPLASKPQEKSSSLRRTQPSQGSLRSMPNRRDVSVEQRRQYQSSLEPDHGTRKPKTSVTNDLNERMAEIKLRNVLDIDANDHQDHLACSEYVKEIFDHWKRVEAKYLPSKDYMSQQPDLSDKMRSILVDWLVDVHQKFKLSPDTLFLTVNVVDRFLSTEKVVRQKLQLVGVSSMLIASKYHEIYAPETNDFVYISDRAYTREEILKMEATVLNRLGFNVTTPSPNVFLARFMKAAGCNKKSASYATYCLELAQQEYRLVGIVPSQLAASACYLSGKQTSSMVWNETLEHYTGFREEELMETVRVMYNLVASSTPNSRLTAVRRKYSQVKHHEVAKMELLSMSFPTQY